MGQERHERGRCIPGIMAVEGALSEASVPGTEDFSTRGRTAVAHGSAGAGVQVRDVVAVENVGALGGLIE